MAARARDPVTGRFLPGGGGKKRKSPVRAGVNEMVIYQPGYGYLPAPPPKAPPARRGHHRGGFTLSNEDLIEGFIYSIGLDYLGDELDRRGTNIPLGLSGREAAGVGAIYYGRKKGAAGKKYVVAGLINAGPAGKRLLGGRSTETQAEYEGERNEEHQEQAGQQAQGGGGQGAGGAGQQAQGQGHALDQETWWEELKRGAKELGLEEFFENI